MTRLGYDEEQVDSIISGDAVAVRRRPSGGGALRSGGAPAGQMSENNFLEALTKTLSALSSSIQGAINAGHSSQEISNEVASGLLYVVQSIADRQAFNQLHGGG